MRTMEPMQVQAYVLAPVVTVFRRGRAKGRQVVTNEPSPVHTTAYGVRRKSNLHGADVGVEVLAFIPPNARSWVGKRSKAWVDEEHAWIGCLIRDNKKTLAAFLESGDQEWLAAVAPTPAQQKDIS